MAPIVVWNISLWVPSPANITRSLSPIKIGAANNENGSSESWLASGVMKEYEPQKSSSSNHFVRMILFGNSMPSIWGNILRKCSVKRMPNCWSSNSFTNFGPFPDNQTTKICKKEATLFWMFPHLDEPFLEPRDAVEKYANFPPTNLLHFDVGNSNKRGNVWNLDSKKVDHI